MAQKRMFSLAVVDTDTFTDMPCSAQALYFHLGMHGDDGGFVGSPRKIVRAVGCNNDDFRLLVAKGFIIPFESGVVVIRDWNINNTLKNDRYHETVYMAEKSLLRKDAVGRYQLGTDMEPVRNQLGTNAEPEHNITENSSSEVSDDVDSKKKAGKTFPHDSNPYKAAVLLSRCVMDRYPKCKPHTERDLQRWADAIDKCNRLDGYDWSLISDVLIFSQRDPFWRQNIRSGDTFREKFDALYVKLTEEGGGDRG